MTTNVLELGSGSSCLAAGMMKLIMWSLLRGELDRHAPKEARDGKELVSMPIEATGMTYHSQS